MHRTTPRLSSNSHVGVVKWAPADGIAIAIQRALGSLGFEVSTFVVGADKIPECRFLFSFGPYGRFDSLVDSLDAIPKKNRPLLIHWDTEGIPNPRIPRTFLRRISRVLAKFERNSFRCDRPHAVRLAYRYFSIPNRLYRIKLEGHYRNAYERGILDLFVETSQIYAEINSRSQLPTMYVPWGTDEEWYADLHLRRDIDVLWMASHRPGRRARILQWLRRELADHHVRVHVVDGVENPTIHGDQRNEILNRTKIVLNILPNWYYNSFAFRFHLVAGNRALVISEPILPHCPDYVPGYHYVSCPLDRIVDHIVYYLHNERERCRITDNAFDLAVNSMTMVKSVSKIMNKAHEIAEQKEKGFFR